MVMTMRVTLFIISFITLLSVEAVAQGYYRGYSSVGKEVVDGEEMITVQLKPIYKFPRRVDMRRYARLIYNLKKVYPIAKTAKYKLDETERHLMTLEDKQAQRDYIKQVERELKAEYTPVLRRMTFSQGRILIKLIDRETNRTSYELVKQLRGSFSAFFWQSIARIFGANLKMHYDKDGEDKVLEQLIIMYEAGLI